MNLPSLSAVFLHFFHLFFYSTKHCSITNNKDGVATASAVPVKSIWNIECGWVRSSFYPGYYVHASVRRLEPFPPDTQRAFSAPRHQSCCQLYQCLWQVCTCSCLLFPGRSGGGEVNKVCQSFVFLSFMCVICIMSEALTTIMWWKTAAIFPRMLPLTPFDGNLLSCPQLLTHYFFAYILFLCMVVHTVCSCMYRTCTGLIRSCERCNLLQSECSQPATAGASFMLNRGG